MRLRDYVLRRLVLITPVALGLVTMTFLISHVIPADPARVWAGPQARPEQVELIRKRYHLDEPLWIQYYYYIHDLARGDLGFSPYTHRPVVQDILTYFPVTLELTLLSTALTIALGVPLGVISALKRDSWIDHATRILALLGTSTPVFWLGLLMQLVFFYYLGWLPATGRIDVPYTRITGMVLLDTLITGNLVGFADAVKHLIMPSMCLCFVYVGLIARLTRSSMLDVLSADYIRTARSKGLPEQLVVLKHALRNALLPVVTVIGIQFGWLLCGAAITETVFAITGMGRYAANAIVNLDFPSLMGFTLISGISIMVVNLAVDILYAFLDPRIRVGARA